MRNGSKKHIKSRSVDGIKGLNTSIMEKMNIEGGDIVEKKYQGL
jgi:hypothetical protein